MYIKYSLGISWIDDTRIPFVDEGEMEGVCKSDKTKKTYNEDWGNTIYNYKRTGGDTKGRFTPNILVCDDMLNDGSISKSLGRTLYETEDLNIKNEVLGKGWIRTGSDIKDKGTNSRYYDLDKWFEKLINEIK